MTKSPEERKQELLSAADSLFRIKGYERTAVSDIVKQVGVAQGTFYYYFKSKDELADAMIRRMLDDHMGLVSSIAEDPGLSGREKIVKILKEDFVKRGENLDNLDYMHHESNALLHQKMLVESVKAYTPFITAIIEQGIREGSFHTSHPREVVEFFMVGLFFLYDPGIFAWTVEEVVTKLQAIGEILEKLLGAEKDSLDIWKELPDMPTIIQKALEAEKASRERSPRSRS
ncbi:TetR/AcrR family transcriptional regulator [Paenibacillus chitinolyticus]|uniref:TetR/AcrR family transcriptional regulator n=1 Tax=Paenibacillus chitinolyticus TaxID=79263 RepID=UPI0036D79E03